MQHVYRWFWTLLPANPMVLRVVQTASRRSKHFYVRISYLGLLILGMMAGLTFGGGLSGDVSLGELARAGTTIFTAFAYFQVAAVCLIAPIFMASAISSEQSGQTLNILLTTPLSNLQIVLGSLLGRLFFILALLLSGLPLFAIILVFGGVPVSAIFAAFLIAAMVAIVVGSVAVTLAVLRKGGRRDVFVFIIAIVGYLILSFAADRLIRQIRPATTTVSITQAADPLSQNPTNSPSLNPDGLTTWITPLHPILVLQASLNDPDYRPPTAEELAGRNLSWPARAYLANPLATFVTLSACLSFLLVLYSATRLRSIANASPGGILKRALPDPLLRALRLKTATSASGERIRPARTVSQNPIAWRESNTRGNATSAILARIVFCAIAVATAAALIALYHSGKLPTNVRDFTGAILDPAEVFRFALTVLLMLELAVIALVALYTSAGCISAEREDGTLDLMLTTPITPRYYIWGKVRGLIGFLSLLLAVPLITVAMVSAYTALGLALDWPQVTTRYYGPFGQIDAPIFLPEAVFLVPLVLIPFVALCVAIGMSESIKRKTVLAAVVRVVPIAGSILGLTWLCGGSLLENTPALGHLLNAFSPSTGILMILSPWTWIADFAEHGPSRRISLAFAAILAGLGYSLIVYLWVSSMVKLFDKKMRDLSGTT